MVFFSKKSLLMDSIKLFVFEYKYWNVFIFKYFYFRNFYINIKYIQIIQKKVFLNDVNWKCQRQIHTILVNYRPLSNHRLSRS